jgi:hypothetical protein
MQSLKKRRKLPGISFTARRKEALRKVKRKVDDPDRIIAPFDFNPHLPNISQVFKKHHKAMLINAPLFRVKLSSHPLWLATDNPPT